MIDYQEIGNNIKICRIRCNLKQAELAEMVGVTSQHISHVERCQTKPSLTLLVDISTALRVDLYTLLGSNIPVHPDVSISVEFASMLKDAAPEQVKLCLSVCKTIISMTICSPAKRRSSALLFVLSNDSSGIECTVFTKALTAG